MNDKRKIMICDDDQGIINMLELLLEYTGEYTILSEIDSLHIQERLLREHPDMLVVDLWMPVVSGDQVIRRVRETEALRDLPILAISASPDGRKISLDAGANAFLAKPFDMDDILQEVDRLFHTANTR